MTISCYVLSMKEDLLFGSSLDGGISTQLAYNACSRFTKDHSSMFPSTSLQKEIQANDLVQYKSNTILHITVYTDQQLPDQ